MSVYVVDASVAVKWFLPESGAADALRLQDPQHTLHAPTFLDVEVSNVFWKRIRRGDMQRTDADDALKSLFALPVIRHSGAQLLIAAFDLACRLDRTVYDALYLALAIQLNAQMATTDERLVNSLAGTPFAAYIVRLQDVP
jgi:predicted nucleic acid-binding protein